MKKDTVKRVLSLIKPYRVFVGFSLFLSLIGTAAQLLIPVFCGNTIDAMIGLGNVDFYIVLKTITIIGITAFVGAAAQFFLSLCNNKITFSVCRDIRNAISCKFNKIPVSFFDIHRSGDIVSRVVADVDSFADGLLMGFTQLFTGVVTIAAVLIIMMCLNPLIACTVVVLTPLSIIVAKFITTRINIFFKKQAEIRGEETALINEYIEGQKVVRAFGQEDECLCEFNKVNERLAKASIKATFFSSLTNPSMRLVNNIVYAVVAVISGLFGIFGNLSIGRLSIFLSYASQYAKPFNEISGVITELQNALTCAERVFELLDTEEEIPDCMKPINPIPNGEVDLKNVFFSYVPNRPLITDFSLKVSPGEKVAIVGPTGCGKTTLINLLMRFYDVDSGCINIDKVNIKNMTREDLRKRYGMVLQDTWLSPGTVKENIAYGRPWASDEEIMMAAKAAYAHSFIQRLPNGYDTVLGEDGGELSVGQKQLLCIARVMLALPTILILDEATSSIDTRTELKIQAAFAKMMSGRTSFIVAHRLSTIKGADIILVMNNGHIVEQGKHEELLKLDGFYAHLYNSQ